MLVFQQFQKSLQSFCSGPEWTNHTLALKKVFCLVIHLKYDLLSTRQEAVPFSKPTVRQAFWNVNFLFIYLF